MVNFLSYLIGNVSSLIVLINRLLYFNLYGCLAKLFINKFY